MARRLIALLAFACGPATSPPVTPIAVKAPPVTATPPATTKPRLRLPKTFVPTRYDAKLTIDPTKSAIDGSIAITGKISELSAVIWLHGTKLTIKRAVARGTSEVGLTITAHDKEELLEVRAAAPLAPGDWTLAFEYSAPLDTNNTAGAFKQVVAGNAYVYSQLEATYARRVFPCVDEPDNKVPWKLTLDVPKALVAVSNTPGTETVIGELKRVEFAQTKPLPSYLVAFGVGPFDIVDAGKTKHGTPVRIVTLAKRGGEATWAAKTTVPLVEALEEWFGIPYPYEKLDMLSIPLTIGFGAMENAGLITFTETLILHETKASKERLHAWVAVAAHELAHQWFGNLVTMSYWDDIWLNEGFANWMESKVTGKIDPSYRDELGELDERNGALGADALVSARKIRQPIETPDDIANVFDGITYNKGAAVLNMFERYVGAEKFQSGVRAYLSSRAYGNATSKDFVAAIAKAAANSEIELAFSTFLDRPGAPEVTVDVACEGKTAQFRVHQQRYLPLGAPKPAPQGPWSIPMCFAYDVQGKRAEVCALVVAENQNILVPSTTCPRWVMPNVDGRSYYRVAYSTTQITALRDEAWDKLSWSERRAVFFDVDTGMSDGKVPLQLALSFIPKLLAGNDRFTIGAALDLANRVEWLVADELRGKYEYWMRATFLAAATSAGFEPKDSDTLDTETTRKDLVGAVAWTARDPALVAEAKQLAGRYRELPQAMRELVLRIAVDASSELFEQVKQRLYTETDRSRRGELLRALGSVRALALHAKALELTLDTKLDIRETQQLFQSGSTEANRDANRAYFATHADKILARIPPDGTIDQVSGFAWLFTDSCKADKRDEIVAYVKKTFEPLPGGVRTVKQAIESMDTCIAKRKVVGAEVRAWLSGLRIPKPTPAKTPAKAPTKAPAKK